MSALVFQDTSFIIHTNSMGKNYKWKFPKDPYDLLTMFGWCQLEDVSGMRPAHNMEKLVEGRIILGHPCKKDTTYYFQGHAPTKGHIQQTAFLNQHENGMQFYLMCRNRNPCVANAIIWRACFDRKAWEEALKKEKGGVLKIMGELPLIAKEHEIEVTITRDARDRIRLKEVLLHMDYSDFAQIMGMLEDKMDQ